MRKKVNNEFWQDERFIWDRLLLDKESESYWDTYLKENPEKRGAFEKACHDFAKIKLNNYSLSNDKRKELLDKIHKSHIKQQKKHIRYYLYAGLAAACLIGILFFVPDYTKLNIFNTKKELVLLPNNIEQTEVTLVTGNSERIEIENNSTISCDSKIYIQNSKGQKNYLSEARTTQESESAYNTLIVPRGRRSSLQLPDGSKVWVNAGSVLQFPSNFASDKRVIKVEGEVYIEVVRNEAKPFYVQTPKFMVNVLGTSFNVSAYTDEIIQSVVLVKGQVAIKTEDAREIKLIPNQKLEMSLEKSEVIPVDVYDYISWKDGVLQFKGEVVSTILKRLSRYYNVKIECTPSIAGRKCAGELILFDDIDQVMKSLSLLYNFSYRYESETILIE